MKKQEIIGVRYFEKEEYAKDFIEGKIFSIQRVHFKTSKMMSNFTMKGKCLFT